MNQDLFKVNQNEFAVSDSDGNIRLVTSNKDEETIVQILSKENNLEDAYSKLRIANNNIIILENNEYTRKFSNVLLSLVSIVFTILFGYFNMIVTLIGALSLFLIIKGIMCCIFGTKKKNINNLFFAKATKDKTLAEIDALERDIEILKEKADFKDVEGSSYTLDDYVNCYLDNNVIELSQDNSNIKRRVRKLYFRSK